MTFVIHGIEPKALDRILNADAAGLARQGAILQTANVRPGYPCRVTLDDAEIGEDVILFHHESHTAATPYRSAYAIYVRRNARDAAEFKNELPPVMRHRPIALRQFDRTGMLIGASMGQGPTLKDQIEMAFAREDVAYIHAHNAMHGCFVAEIRRD